MNKIMCGRWSWRNACDDCDCYVVHVLYVVSANLSQFTGSDAAQCAVDYTW